MVKKNTEETRMKKIKKKDRLEEEKDLDILVILYKTKTK